MELKLSTPIQFLKGVGPKLGDTLRKKGIATVQDLLEWYPRNYEDRRSARSISSLRADDLVSLKAQVVRVSSFQMGKSRRKIYEVMVRDATGSMRCKYFRVPYKGYFERFRPQQSVRVVGKVTQYRGQLEFHHPDIQDEGGSEAEQDQLIPVYPESEGFTNRQLRKLLAGALGTFREQQTTAMKAGGHNRFDGKKDIEVFDKLPEWIRQEFQLPDRFQALENIHCPPNSAGSDFIDQKSVYHRRIIFEEFFWLELYLASKKSGLKKERAPILNRGQRELVDRLVKTLPFQLTSAQLKSFSDIYEDLAKPHPMHRLVQGDVGCGKTMVALLSALVAVEAGSQVCLMAPTEILAEQHYRNAQKLLEPLGVTVGLLTGSMKASEKNQTVQLLSQGLVQICVGTHALIQEGVEFKNLGLAIIDEQHRFGVQQRNQLKNKGLSPHFLVMTATPIPRTLAMTVYGDLDVSIIDELPPGRSPIVTRVTYESRRAKVMGFLLEQLAKGRQAYIVYPLVEESEKIDLKDAVTEYERLGVELSGYRIGLLHGKMKAGEKDEVMRKFRDGEFHVLVATTVIEVGVDVPNANIMIIEHSERFGLSQLHQLRGRVGRGEHKSYCVLMLGHAVSDESRARCEIMEKTTDGFKIAEADLEIRGPGEFMGARQSGLSGFKMANLVRDIEILQEARNAAFKVMANDASLSRPEHRFLRDELLSTNGGLSLVSAG